jgi:hypothetical protein
MGVVIMVTGNWYSPGVSGEHCWQCGASLREGSRVCITCGADRTLMSAQMPQALQESGTGDDMETAAATATAAATHTTTAPTRPRTTWPRFYIPTVPAGARAGDDSPDCPVDTDAAASAPEEATATGSETSTHSPVASAHDDEFSLWSGQGSTSEPSPAPDDVRSTTVEADAPTAGLAPSSQPFHVRASVYVPGRPAEAQPLEPWNLMEREDDDGVRGPLEWLLPIVRRVLNVLFSLGYGVLGALIGGGLWYAICTATHLEFGPCAVLMGYLAGKGVAMGTTTRTPVNSMLAILLTIAVWVVCISQFLAQGISLTLLDPAFLVISVSAALAPNGLLPQHQP